MYTILDGNWPNFYSNEFAPLDLDADQILTSGGQRLHPTQMPQALSSTSLAAFPATFTVHVQSIEPDHNVHFPNADGSRRGANDGHSAATSSPP